MSDKQPSIRAKRRGLRRREHAGRGIVGRKSPLPSSDGAKTFNQGSCIPSRKRAFLILHENDG
jgi:hypothetical protein